MSDVVAKLSAVVGAERVSDWAAVLQAQQFTTDEVMGAIASDQPPNAIAFPSSTPELAQVMALAAKNHWRVLPTGQGSKLSWGGLAEGVDLVVSTARLNQVVDHAVGDFTVTVGPGLKVAALKQILAEQGQLLAIDPAFAARATVGGVVATADTGSLRQRYGGLRDMLIGVQFVRYDGEVARAGGRVVKNVAGYDLMKLMSGAYGSLGILSELTFRLYPVQGNSRSLLLTGTTTAVEKAVADVRLSGLTPVALDILAATMLSQAAGDIGLVARFQGVAAGVEEQTERLQKIALMHGLSCQQLDGTADEDFWRQSAQAIKPDTVLCKVGMRPSAVPALLTLLTEVDPTAQARLYGSSGLGWVQMAVAEKRAGQIAGLERLRSHCQQNAGFLSILQAPKPLKQAVDVWGYSGNALEVMRDIKEKFDPQRILSPGRFVGGL
ncbi:MAG: FAD-binding oxidoreductase [Phormidesmis sp.]